MWRGVVRVVRPGLAELLLPQVPGPGSDLFICCMGEPCHVHGVAQRPVYVPHAHIVTGEHSDHAGAAAAAEHGQHAGQQAFELARVGQRRRARDRGRLHAR